MSNIRTPFLWPIKARGILIEKKVDISFLYSLFSIIYFPWDKDYDFERTYFSLRIQQRPLFIIRAKDTTELENILNYVKEKNLTIRIMNGRHSSQLCNPEVLVDISLFNNIIFNRTLEGDILTVGAGQTQGGVNNYLFHHEDNKDKNYYSHFGHFLHPRIMTEEGLNSGSASTVGCNILTIGGVSTLVRSYGLAIDDVIEYTVTIPPNEREKSITLTVNENNNKDLFWALRGGGVTNFGIMSSLKVRAIEVPNIISYTIMFNNKDKYLLILEEWQKQSIHRSIQYNEDLSLFNGNGKVHLEISGTYLMKKAETYKEAEESIKRQLSFFISLGDLKISREIEYKEYYRMLIRERIYDNFSIIQTLFSLDYNSKLILSMMDKAKNIKSNISISFTLLGGKVKEKRDNETAFFPRNANFFIDIATRWDSIEESQITETWMDKVMKVFLHNYKEKFIYLYVGFPLTFTNIKIDGNVYYGNNYERLKEIKNIYDPLNIMTTCGTIK